MSNPQKQIFTTRAAKILALLPLRGDISDLDDDDEDLPEEQLEVRINQFFEGVELEQTDGESHFSQHSLHTSNNDDQAPRQPDVIVNQSTPSTNYMIHRRNRLARFPTSDCQNSTDHKKPKKTIRKKKIRTYNWRRGDLYCGGANLKKIQDPEEDPEDEDVKESPADIFLKFFTEDLISLIIYQSNLYFMQIYQRPLMMTKDDFLDFLAIEILMGVVHMSAYTDYWSKSLRYDRVANIMSLKRYQDIRKGLHFVDNSQANNDLFFKVRPLISHFRKVFSEVDNKETKFSIDECMVPYKGGRAGSLRQFMRDKPCRWGFKFFVRCGLSGFVYDLFPYCGSQTFDLIHFTNKEEKLSFTEKVVVGLTKSISDPILTAVYMDNFYSSPNLFLYLRNHLGIFSLGTFRSARLAGANKVFRPDKELIKAGRGTFDYVVDKSKKIVLIKWVDNKIVTIGSTYVGVGEVREIERWDKNSKTRRGIACPDAILEYNKFMGGVDLMDMLYSLYRSPLRSHKWYMILFVYFLDLSIINSWILYKKKNPNCRLKGFRVLLAEQLVLYRRPKRGRPNSSGKSPTPPRKVYTKRKFQSTCVPESVMKDQVAHLAIFRDRGKCRLCHTNKTNVFCDKCQIRLCLTIKRNCFHKAHV